MALSVINNVLKKIWRKPFSA